MSRVHKHSPDMPHWENIGNIAYMLNKAQMWSLIVAQNYVQERERERWE